jgi:hypothetical protein
VTATQKSDVTQETAPAGVLDSAVFTVFAIVLQFAAATVAGTPVADAPAVVVGPSKTRGRTEPATTSNEVIPAASRPTLSLRNDTLPTTSRFSFNEPSFRFGLRCNPSVGRGVDNINRWLATGSIEPEQGRHARLGIAAFRL